MKLFSLFLVGIACFGMTFLSTNPDYILPLYPELIILSIFLYWFSFSEKILDKRWFYRNFYTVERITIYFLCFFVFIVTPIRVFYSFIPTENIISTPCLNVGSTIHIFECFLQDSILGTYGLRTYYMLFTACIIGLISFFMSRLHEGYQDRIFIMIAIIAQWVVISGHVGNLLDAAHILPTRFGVNPWIGRAPSVFTNPGWLWVYLAPGFCIHSWKIIESKGQCRNIWIIGWITIAFSCITTEQRSALLLVLLQMSVFIWLLLRRCFFEKKLPILLLVCSVCMSIVIFSSDIGFVIQEILQKFMGVDRDLFNLESTRWKIWQAAVELIYIKPFWGHGYASWFYTIGHYFNWDSHYPIFDTAHNLVLQLLVEGGFIFGGIYIVGFISVGYIIFKNNIHNQGRLILAFLTFLIFILSSFVQEIDYVRSTYYIYAIFIATLAATCRNYSQDHSTDTVSLITKNLLSFFSYVFLISGIFLSLTISDNMFPFEGHRAKPSNKIGRWTGENTKLTLGGVGKDFEVYEIEKSVNMTHLYTVGSDQGALSVDSNKKMYFSFNKPSQWPFHRASIKMKPWMDNSRLVGLRIIYPAIKSKLGLLVSDGLYNYEKFSKGGGWWCGDTCWFVARNPKKSFKVQLSNTYTDESIVDMRIQWSAWEIGKSIDDKKIGEHFLLPPIHHGNLNFSKRSTMLLELPKGENQTGHPILMKIKPEKSFKELSGARVLSIVIGDGSFEM